MSTHLFVDDGDSDPARAGCRTFVAGRIDVPERFADLGRCCWFRIGESRLDPNPEFDVGDDLTVIGLRRLTTTTDDDSDPDPPLSRDPLTDRRFVEEGLKSERTGDIIYRKKVFCLNINF